MTRADIPVRGSDGVLSASGLEDPYVLLDARSMVACDALRSVLSDPSALARCLRSSEVESALQPILLRLCAW